ncbi:HAMP domain-containing histidine kinase [Paenibacillus sp. TRM 82003]|uniref:sensor histidine kinase n=1 Tax=Kineococcus sp. TRM81007 TaxID=2925831 RepID=UPI001F587BD2|nr:HAMP domain-containing sensor histidine kinase [Kineococcus sp. TRM81007]MCI2240308.1 HAMP domain-containing histidine kinase [Kineococcus sp. TRM81007]MCI3927515.1 HAMP domain-containing histidine kinase [Paenibacillus sp. TRM 82003]
MSHPPPRAHDGQRATRPRAVRWRSLRGRATVLITGLVLVLSAVTTVAVWTAVSQYLLVHRQRSAVAQASANAAQVERGLRTRGLPAPDLLAQLPRESGSTSLLLQRGEWTTTSLTVGADDLPTGLRRAVVDGSASSQRVEVDGGVALVVGVPLAGIDDAYFEVFGLGDLDRTFRALSTGMLAGAALLPCAALLLGRWLARPALRPLEEVSTAAAAIAAGDLGARIEPHGDPLLVPLATSFNGTARALERRVLADARFAADVAHELRTPLTTITAALAIVQARREHLPEDAREGLDLLGHELDRFHRLVLDLLEISRSSGDGTLAAVEGVLLPDLVERSLPEAARHLLVVEPEARRVRVCADKRRLRQVVVNLVENAEQHGGGATRVTVSCTAEHGLVAVDDAGPGVPVGDRERVFERFARGRSGDRASTGGAGLGLSLVVRHLEAMDARVAVTDSPDGGARFVVSLPREDA